MEMTERIAKLEVQVDAIKENVSELKEDVKDLHSRITTGNREILDKIDSMECKLEERMTASAEVSKKQHTEIEVNVQLGQVWQLGTHRLMCGDSLNSNNVNKLMNEQKADMVFTDPPYGMSLDVNYDSMFNNDLNHQKTGNRFNKVIGDDQYYSPKHILEYFNYCNEIFLWGADYYFWELPKGGSIFCWDKRINENMDKVVGNCLELCWSKSLHKKEVIRMLWSGYHGMSKDDTKQRIHPTQKPNELGKWFLDKFSKEQDLIVDLFLGSGSTIIACQKTNRICYGMELDPYYCQVIINRWEKYTGLKAELIEA